MIIGVIGGIGSGKSLATDYLGNRKGFQTVKTDLVAFDLMEQEGPVKDELIRAFGPDIYREDGKLDRSAYGKILYGSAENRAQSDRIVHPAVWEKVSELIRKNRSLSSNLNSAVETALPSGELRSLCDEIWYIRTEEETRIRRLMITRNYSRERAAAVICSQPSDTAYRMYSDRILSNDGLPEDLFKQIDRALN